MDCDDTDPNKTTDCSEKPCNKFDNRISQVLNTEAGFVNDPVDPGGATNRGIAWKTWQAYAQSVLGQDSTLDNLKSLTADGATQIYKSMYWDRIRADEITDGDTRFLFFDFYVNAPKGSVETIQETLNELGESLVVDGRFGQNTLDAINRHADDINFYNSFKDNRQGFYDDKIAESVAKYLEKHPNATEEELRKNTKKKYENGWKNRVDEFKDKTNEKSKDVNCDE